MIKWIDGKIYPQESGYYRARFKSGKERIAYFTLLTTSNEDGKSHGKWGSTHPSRNWENYIPLIDPIEWQQNSCQTNQKKSCQTGQKKNSEV